ncbi:MAG: tetratricopeptide repeat protein [Myxococcota bacterium]
MGAVSLLLGWLALGAAAQAPADAPLDVPAGPSMSDDQRASAFTGWATAMASGNRESAAQALIAILDDPSLQPVHGEAWGHLGEYYAQLGLKLAAVGAMGRGMALDPVHADKFAAQALQLVDEIDESGLVGEAVGKNVGIRVDGEARNLLAVTAARYQVDHDSFGPAQAILMMADRNGKEFDTAEMLRGVILSQQGQYGDALVPLQTALAMGIQNERDEKWVDTAKLNVARAYYAAGNYGQAIASYASISRDSDYWLDAQFERAWAHFRGNDTNGALAMLYNHQSPFFEDFYYPEADLLRAYSLFVMCKFTDASAEMDRFQQKYEPVLKELGGLSPAPEAAFDDVIAFRRDKPTQLPGYVLRPFRHEQRFTDAIATVERAADELKDLKKVDGKPGELARELIETQRDARIRAEGQRVIDRIDRAERDLGSMLEGIEITRLDLLALETQMYERAAATGVLDYGNHIGKMKELRRTKRGFRVWPWQGEYWADELGWYVFNARPDCPESMARGEDGSSR